MTDEVQKAMFEQALRACVEIGKLNGEQKGWGKADADAAERCATDLLTLLGQMDMGQRGKGLSAEENLDRLTTTAFGLIVTLVRSGAHRKVLYA